MEFCKKDNFPHKYQTTKRGYKVIIDEVDSLIRIHCVVFREGRLNHCQRMIVTKDFQNLYTNLLDECFVIINDVAQRAIGNFETILDFDKSIYLGDLREPHVIQNSVEYLYKLIKTHFEN